MRVGKKYLRIIYVVLPHSMSLFDCMKIIICKLVHSIKGNIMRGKGCMTAGKKVGIE